MLGRKNVGILLAFHQSTDNHTVISQGIKTYYSLILANSILLLHIHRNQIKMEQIGCLN